MDVNHKRLKYLADQTNAAFNNIKSTQHLMIMPKPTNKLNLLLITIC
jgi:hypothetical protein